MANFLDVAEHLYKRKEVGDAADGFERVFRGVASLNAAHSKAVLDVDNIESVFGAFEMARLCRKLGPLNADEIDKLGPSIRRLIAVTLEKSIRYRMVSGSGTPLPPKPYEPFYELAREISQSALGPVSFRTFNYDLALDYTAHFYGDGIDYFGTPAYTGVPV